jgi:hypothetical protein
MTVSKFSTSSIYLGNKLSILKGDVLDGSSRAKAAPNASYLKTIGITTNGLYWINIGGTPSVVYCDLNTASGAWYLLAYASSGITGLLNVGNNGYEPLVRYNADFAGTPNGARTGYRNFLPLINSSTNLAFSWNQTGVTPSGGILTYDNAISFPTPSSNMTLDGSLTPPVGSSGSTFCVGSTSSSTASFAITNLKGTHGLSGTYYTRKESFAVNYGTSYGIVKPQSGQNQLDWGPDGQTFSVVYWSFTGNTNSAYVTPSGTGNGYVPSVMALWARSA